MITVLILTVSGWSRCIMFSFSARSLILQQFHLQRLCLLALPSDASTPPPPPPSLVFNSMCQTCCSIRVKELSLPSANHWPERPALSSLSWSCSSHPQDGLARFIWWLRLCHLRISPNLAAFRWYAVNLQSSSEAFSFFLFGLVRLGFIWWGWDGRQPFVESWVTAAVWQACLWVSLHMGVMVVPTYSSQILLFCQEETWRGCSLSTWFVYVLTRPAYVRVLF